jgi:hypothetical protein
MYCVDDPDQQIVGAATDDIGRSPKNLLVDTLGDVLKLNRPGSRVFGLSMKDRAAILMSGHLADAAYWLEGGKWVTSTYYRNDLPPYLRVLNEQNTDEKFLGQTWTLLYPLEQYTHYYADDAPFEGTLAGSGSKFPHILPDKTGKSYHTALTTSPFGNDYTLLAAQTLIEAEQLGKRDTTDMLTLNLSSNDYVGHTFGPHSLEVQDITFRTDRQLGALAAFIDKHLGRAPWVLAITSDHGVAPVPEFATSLKVPAGRGSFNRAEMEQKIEAALVKTFGQPSGGGKYVRKMEEGEVYLDHGLHELQGRNLADAENVVREVLFGNALVAVAFTRHDLLGQLGAQGLALRFQRACHPTRSGDVLFAVVPYHVPKGSTATHGSPWNYDSHVPLLIRGGGIRPGRYSTAVTPAALAPTLARLLDLEPPAGCEVEALHEAILPQPPGKASQPGT